MLKPDKFTDLNKSIVYTVAIILAEFKKNKYKCNYNDLYTTIEEHLGEDAFYLFLPSLDFLFLLGKLKYDIGSDMLEMII
ncbi:hypothetical protein QUF79_26320 [Fictibacillus enclensis]|nr:hypothetical protein [Fictibacillus enclensis]